jgi:Fur family transcriptional regulator, ferric uptake regulator
VQVAAKNRSDWVELALGELRAAGHRSGGARRRVVELLGREDCALTALEIDRRLESVGRASVYRALDQLEELGLVQRLDVGGNASGYEKVGPAGDHHHHLLCERCGKIVPFEDPKLERVVTAIASGAEFRLSGHDVTLRGTCERCR